MASKLKFSVLNCWPRLAVLTVSCILMPCLVPVQTVLSHGILLESSFVHGSVLQVSPNRVVLHFNAILEPSITQVNLIDLQAVLTPLDVTNDSTMNTVVAKFPRCNRVSTTCSTKYWRPMVT